MSSTSRSEIVLVALLFVLLAQVARTMFPQVIVLGEDWDYLYAGLISIAVFAAPILAWPLASLRERHLSATVAMIAARVALQLHPISTWLMTTAALSAHRDPRPAPEPRGPAALGVARPRPGHDAPGAVPVVGSGLAGRHCRGRPHDGARRYVRDRADGDAPAHLPSAGRPWSAAPPRARTVPRAPTALLAEPRLRRLAGDGLRATLVVPEDAVGLWVPRSGGTRRRRNAGRGRRDLAASRWPRSSRPSTASLRSAWYPLQALATDSSRPPR
jgi:hypothetical protein